MKRIHLFIFAICPVLMMLTLACGSEEKLPDGVFPSSEYFKIVGDTVFIDGQGTEASFTVTADCGWSIQTSGWSDLHVTPDRGEGTQTVKISTPVNDDPTERKATMTVSTNDGITKTMKIIQAAGNVIIEVEPKSLSFGKAGGTQQVTVISNTSWKVTGGADGFSIDVNEGKGNGTITVIATENTSTEGRNATFTVTAGNTQRTFTVTQSNKDINLVVSPENLTFGATTELDKQIEVTCNDSWVAKVSHDWLTLNKKQGTGDATLTVSCQANNTGTPRSATVTVTCNGVSATVSVTQNIFDVSFKLIPETLPDVSYKGEELRVTVISNTSWTVSGGSGWCHVKTSDGGNSVTGNGEVIITVDANNDTSEKGRDATIVILPNGSTEVTLTIHQAPRPSVDVYDLELSDTLNFQVTANAKYYSKEHINEYGFVYAAHSEPTVENHDGIKTYKHAEGQGIMETTTFTGLTIGVRYYVRAYATTDNGTVYSEEKSFTAQGREPSPDDNGTPTPARKK